MVEVLTVEVLTVEVLTVEVLTVDVLTAHHADGPSPSPMPLARSKRDRVTLVEQGEPSDRVAMSFAFANRRHVRVL